MKTLKDLLVALDPQKETYPFQVHFRFPNICLRVQSERFAGQDREARLALLASVLSFSESELGDACFHANVFLQLETKQEQESDPDVVPDQGEGWIKELLVDMVPADGKSAQNQLPEQVRTLHFYGYKGGQGRSTVLAWLARTLAHDGYRVLVIDIDQEAPSLHILLSLNELRLENTLLGISMDQPVTPVAISGQFRQKGAVDLIGCFPTEDRYALESVALALRSGMDALWSARCAEQLDAIRRAGDYDVLLVDHRSGLSAFSLPWMHALPGPVVFFSRLDQQWKTAAPFVPALFRVYPPVPGVIVSFADSDSLDTGAYLDAGRAQWESLLKLMETGLKPSIPGVPRRMFYDGNWESLEERFVIWPHDVRLTEPASIEGNPQNLSHEVRRCLHDLRRLLELSDSKLTSLHGLRDPRQRLLLPTMQEVLKEHSPIRYIFGRKGTGKTGLCALLADSDKSEESGGLGHRVPGGELLLVDPGSETDGSTLGRRAATHGLNVNDERWQERIFARFDRDNDQEGLFWMLFAAGLKAGKEPRGALWDCLDEMATRTDSTVLARQELDKVLSERDRELGQPEGRRTFLLDGLELLLSKKTKRQRDEYVAALFRVLANIQSDAKLSARIDFRLFLRSDLVPLGHQNLEQQLGSQVVRLRWDIKDLLRFLLSRMLTLNVVQQDFQAPWAEIKQRSTDILDNRIEVDELERLLALVFPRHVPWKANSSVPLSTFWREFFADSPKVGAKAEPKTYYPRVADVFLQTIDRTPPAERLYGDRLDPKVVVKAYEAAAASVFLKHIEQEVVLCFSGDKTRAAAFFAELAGRGSVFDPSQLPRNQQHLLSQPDFADALLLLEEMGVFTQVRQPGSVKLQAGVLVQTTLQLDPSS